MRIVESVDSDLDACVEIPDEWLAGDWAAYATACERARQEYQTPDVSRLAGVMALLSDGRVRALVRGRDMRTAHGAGSDVMAVELGVMGFLLKAVGRSLEETQLVPFFRLRRCMIGTRARATKSRRRRVTGACYT